MKKRCWDKIHKLEENSVFLKNLTLKDRYRIFLDLYRMIDKFKSNRAATVFNPDKIKTLSQTHFIFKKLTR